MSATDLLPNAVDPTFDRDDDLGLDEHGQPVRLLFYPDGAVRFEHVCSRVDRGVIRCAPALADAHQVIDLGHGHATVVPSVLCEDCGLHGFITDGTWRTA